MLIYGHFCFLKCWFVDIFDFQNVDNEKIAEGNYDLSVSSYVEKKDTREVIDIDVLNAEIKKTVKNIDRLRSEIDAIIAEIEG